MCCVTCFRRNFQICNIHLSRERCIKSIVGHYQGYRYLIQLNFQPLGKPKINETSFTRYFLFLFFFLKNLIHSLLCIPYQPLTNALTFSLSYIIYSISIIVHFVMATTKSETWKTFSTNANFNY